LANLQVIVGSQLWKKVNEKEKLFREKLSHNAIKNIRGKGLMLAIEFESFGQNKQIIDRCLEKGVLTDWFLFADNCLRVAPPLIISEEQIDYACNIILEAIE
jgi:4-aminobutyrate aminotransferase-like enzyme